jgi:DNA-binding CsgD family transcriptional regulator
MQQTSSSDPIGQHFRWIVDGLRIGVLICDPSGTVVYCNRAAGACLSRNDGIAVRDGRLSVDATPACEVLVAALAAAEGQCEILVRRGKGARPYAVFVHVLVPGFDETGLKLVTIADPDVGHERGGESVRRIHGLTAAELRLADGLLSGLALAEIAGRARITINTVRTQLKQLFAKTETKRQVDLLRLLSASIPVFAQEQGDNLDQPSPAVGADGGRAAP